MNFSISRLRPSDHNSRVRSKMCALILMLGLCAGPLRAQVNSGSDGHDGAFNPTQDVTIDMTDHPDGIYQYTSVNIPQGVKVTFSPNATNTPVIWLVQGNCTISGNVDLSGKTIMQGLGSLGGPGGFRGGAGGGQTVPAEAGIGPGGGSPGVSDASNKSFGGAGSFATVGSRLYSR